MKGNSSAIPVKKNDDITLLIDNIDAEGHGIGRVDGYCIFVPYALPGENIRAHIIKVTSSYAVAKLTEVITASPSRTDPRCPYFYRCGGCTVRHLNYPAQLDYKTQLVKDALKRIGGLNEPIVLDTIGMEEPERYRNKGSFPFRQSDAGPAYGLFSARSHRLVPVDDCAIEDKRIIKIIRNIGMWAVENNIPAYNEETGKGILRHAAVRVTTTGETMVVIVTTGKLPKQEALFDALADCDSIWHNVNSKNTNVIFGDRFTLLSGKPSLTEEILRKRFSVSPMSFLQVNPVQTEVLYSTALKLLAPKTDETLLDIYCGIGTISLIAADHVKEVIGIEAIPQAIEDARHNAELNSITNARFICGNAEDILPKSGFSADAIVIDPPRKGCDPAVLDSILGGNASRMVYVSCNPATLARDLAILIKGGFGIETVQPVDMFPGTGHVETVVLLSR